MDYNGNDVSGGAGSLPDPLDIPAICAENGTFQNLDVGACGDPALYQLPRVAKDPAARGAVIVDESAQTINISNIQRVMQAFYVAIDSFSIPETGDYTIYELVQLVQDGFNAKYAAETNVMTMWVGNDGHVRARITEGSQPSFRMVETLGLLQMGNTADSGAIPPNTTYRFPSPPNYSGTVQQSGWRGYQFDDTGYIFQGDMRITGALEVSTIVSDLEVEDSLIFINKNQPSDNFSSGLVINTFNNTRYSGLVKADTGNDFHLFGGSATIPTASGWVPVSNGNMFLRTAHLNDDTAVGTFTVKGDDINQPVVAVNTLIGHLAALQEWRADGLLQASLSSNGRFDANVLGALTIGCRNFTVGQPGTTYTLPPARGAAGQILITDGVGNVSWQSNPGLLPGEKIVSPDTLNEVVAENDQILTKYGGVNRVYVDDTTTDILSGDTSYVVSTSNSRVLISDATPGGRLEIANAETTLKSPDKGTLLTILNDDMYADVGATQPFRATPIVTTIKGGGGNDPTITLQSGTSSWAHSTRQCLTTAPSTVQVGYDAGNLTYTKYEAAGILDYYAGTIRSIVDNSNTFLYSPDGVTGSLRIDDNVFIARTGGADRLSIGGAESVLRSPGLANRISVANVATRITGECEINGLLECQVKAQTNDNVPLQIGSTSSTATQKPITMKFVANAIIPAGRVVKIVDVGGSGRVESVGNADPDSTGVVGITYTSSAAAGDDIEVTIGGVWEACLLNGNTVVPGDPIEKSDTGGANVGRVQTSAPSVGSFGIALTGGTGDAGGTVFIRGVFRKNESF